MTADRPPLREVVVGLSPKAKQIHLLDDQISASITTIEHRLHELKLERIVSAKLPDGSELGWSRDRRSRRWRFVIRTEDAAWELQSCTSVERAEVFSCGAMEKLLRRAGVLND